LLGDSESYAELGTAVKFRVPMPVLFMLKDDGGGLEPPAIAVKMRFEGDTDKTGWLAAALEPYAARGELAHTCPVDQVEGKAVRFVSMLVSDRLPLGSLSRNASVPKPDGLRIAIQ